MKQHERLKRSMTKRKLSYLVGLTPIKLFDNPRSAFVFFQEPITWWDIHSTCRRPIRSRCFQPALVGHTHSILANQSEAETHEAISRIVGGTYTQSV